MVKEIRENELVLQNGDTVPYGICVWYGSHSHATSLYVFPCPFCMCHCQPDACHEACMVPACLCMSRLPLGDDSIKICDDS